LLWLVNVINFGVKKTEIVDFCIRFANTRVHIRENE